MAGDFNVVRNHTLFEDIRTRVVRRLSEMDPKAAFQRMNPGFLADLYEPIGPWLGREEMRWEVPGVAEDAQAVSARERAHLGSTDMFHIAGEPGIFLAGRSQSVGPDDFRRGMTVAQATERAGRPVTDWNQKVAKAMFDNAIQGAFSSATDDFSDNFAWTATDQVGNTVTQNLATQSADTVATVIANSTQSVAWPLADGSETSTGHDHLLAAQGADWTEALADTARDLILEHPGMGVVRAYVGSNVAADVTAAIKSGYGAIESRVDLVSNPNAGTAGGFAEAQPLSRPIGGVSYIHVPNMPDNIALYVAANQRPFYVSAGANDANGSPLNDEGAWARPVDEETKFREFGYRRHAALGSHVPIAAVVAEYTI